MISTLKRHICISFTSKLYEVYVKLVDPNNKSLITYKLASLESTIPLDGCCLQTQDWHHKLGGIIFLSWNL
jgi:hypothetical protein